MDLAGGARDNSGASFRRDAFRAKPDLRVPLPSDFKTLYYQISIWIEGHDLTSRDLMRLTLGPWARLFDGETVTLPELPGIPPEIPKLNLSSSDRRWKLQAATRRLNVVWERVDDGDVLPPTAFLRALPEVIRPFLEASGDLKATRLAYVLRRFANVATPSRDLAQYFVRPELLKGPLNRPSDFELHAHKVYEPTGFEALNSWIRWKTGTLTSNQAAGILVEQDLNTLAERDQSEAFAAEAVESFLSTASSEAEEILKFYLSFPVNESSGVHAVRP